MKYIVITLAFAILAFPVFADEKEGDVSFAGPSFGAQPGTVEDPNDFFVGTFTFGVWQRDSDSISSKFLEYRDIPNGGVVPFFRLNGKKGDLRYDSIGHDVTQKDQRYLGFLEGKNWKIDVDYVGVPHSFGNGGKSILTPVSELDGTEWRLSDTLQESFHRLDLHQCRSIFS